MPGPLDAFGRIDVNPPALPDPGPAAPDGFFANFGRAFSGERLVARSDRFDAEDLRLNREYGPILDALGLPGSDNPAGFSDHVFRGGTELHPSSLKKGEGWQGNMATRAEQEMLVAEAIGRRQANDPNFLKGVPANVDGLHKWMLQREAERRAGAEQRVGATRGIGATLGSLAGGALEAGIDTPNLVTLPIGGVGRNVATRMLTEGLAMAGITAAEQPTVAANREQLGAGYTAGDAAFNIGTAFVGGALFRGAGEGIGHAAGAMGSAVRSTFPDWARQRDADAFGKAMNRAIGLGRFDKAQLPGIAARMMDPSFAAMPDEEAAAQVAREMAAGTMDDRAIAAAFAREVPEDRRTPDEKGALAHVGREADVAESSPFEPDPAGERAHGDAFTEALSRITDEGGARPAPSQPLHQPAAGPPPLQGGMGGMVEGEGAIRAFKTKTRQAESGGVDGQKNPLSSASGRYQFTRPTWLSYYRRRYPGTREKADAIWAKRNDADLQEVLMDDLTRDNARGLRAAGLPVTERNLYLRHFLGPRADEVLRAHPARPIAELVPQDFIARNPRVLTGKTAGEVIAWADRKMGGAGDGASVPGMVARDAESVEAVPARPDLPDGPEAAPAFHVDEAALGEPIAPLDHEPRGDAGDDLDRPSIRHDLFATPEDHARAQVALWNEQDRAAGLFHEEPAPPHSGPAPAGKSIEVADKAPRKRSGPVDVMQAVADAGGIIDNEGHDLVKGRGIPKFVLGAGSIIRAEGHPRGRSIDGIGEYLWEKGYFGPPSVTARPDESQVIDLLEQATRERVFIPGEEGAVHEDGLHQSEQDARDELSAAAREAGVELDPATLDAAMNHRAAGAPVNEAVETAAREAAYRDMAEPAGLERFDDPELEAAAAQAESLDHDLRMALVPTGRKAVSKAADATEARRASLLATMHGHGTTRVGYIDHLIEKLNRDLPEWKEAPNRHDYADDILAGEEKLSDLEAIRDDAAKLDQRHEERRMAGAMLSEARDELKVSIATGEISDAEARARVEQARQSATMEQAIDVLDGDGRSYAFDDREMTLGEALSESDADAAVPETLRACMAPAKLEAAE